MCMLRKGGARGRWLRVVRAGPPKKQNVWKVSYAYFVSYTYFILLNVPQERLTQPRYVYVGGGVRACVYAHVCVRACMRECVCVCACMCVCVRS